MKKILLSLAVTFFANFIQNIQSSSHAHKEILDNVNLSSQADTYKKDRKVFMKQKKHILEKYPQLQNPILGKAEALREACIEIMTAQEIEPSLCFDSEKHPYFAAICTPIPLDDATLPFPKDGFFDIESLVPDEREELAQCTSINQYYTRLFFYKEKLILKSHLIEHIKQGIIKNAADIVALFDEILPNTWNKTSDARYHTPRKGRFLNAHPPRKHSSTQETAEMIRLACEKEGLDITNISFATGEKSVTYTKEGHICLAKEDIQDPYTICHEVHHIKEFENGSLYHNNLDMNPELSNRLKRLEETKCDILPSINDPICLKSCRDFNEYSDNAYDDVIHPLTSVRLQYIKGLQEHIENFERTRDIVEAAIQVAE